MCACVFVYELCVCVCVYLCMRCVCVCVCVCARARAGACGPVRTELRVDVEVARAVPPQSDLHPPARRIDEVRAPFVQIELSCGSRGLREWCGRDVLRGVGVVKV